MQTWHTFFILDTNNYRQILYDEQPLMSGDIFKIKNSQFGIWTPFSQKTIQYAVLSLEAAREIIFAKDLNIWGDVLLAYLGWLVS